MFDALGRYLRSFFYLITGRVDSARGDLNRNPYVIQATFENILREKTQRISQYKDAVAGMIAQQEKKRSRARELTQDVERLEQLRTGAAAKAKSVVEQLRREGLTPDQIKTHVEYLRCQAAYKDFSSTLEEKSEHAEELERDIREIEESVGRHKLQLQELLRDLDKLKAEASATVADVMTAREEEEIANMLAGISEDRTNKELQEMRELRQKTKARAKVARELAGTEVKNMETEFMEYARRTASSDEFDKLIGLAEQVDRSDRQQEAPSATRLPES